MGNDNLQLNNGKIVRIMTDQIDKLLSEAKDWIKQKEYEKAEQLIAEVLKMDENNKKADKLYWELYALMLDKNMRDNLEGYEHIIKKELGEEWSEFQDLWQEYIDGKVNYAELTDKAYKREYTNSSFHAISLAIREAQLVFIEEMKES